MRVEADCDGVRWSVGQEIDVAYYTVEALGGEGEWTAIAQLDADGTQEYTAEVITSGKAAYYRVVGVDVDGTRTVSEAVAVGPCGKTGGGEARAWPNPARVGERVVLEFGANAIGTPEIFDVRGRMVARTLRGGRPGTFTFEASGLAVGVYTARVSGEAIRFILR